uniref:Transcriptional repressor rco-1 n=1 Tax=Ganoderma boninense TaxID=34458 RepID=A0A5K1K6U2_9APHY|nr:Transcriptional repressor rco-1 [Ganoderma boninense]
MVQVSPSTMSSVFKEYAGAPLCRKLLSLVPGLRESFTNTFGERKGKMMMQMTAGCLTGINKIVLHSLDVLNIDRQVNPEA